MALQKRRRGPKRIRQQRSAWMRKSGNNRPMVQACANCGAPRVPHRVCMACGQYGGTQVVKAKSEAE